MRRVTMVVFEGGRPRSEVEELVSSVRKAVVLDNLERFSALEGLDRILLFTTYEDLAREAARQGAHVELVPARGRFHFGRELANIVRARGLQAVLYLGGAAGSLLERAEMERAVRALASSDELMVANNLFSSDIVGFAPASVLLDLTDLPRSDNALAMSLSGMPVMTLDEEAGSLFDVDTPADAMVLGLHPRAGPRARETLGRLDLEPARGRLHQAAQVLGTPFAEVAFIGRVNPGAVLHVNRNLRCRTRVFSEERGMKALGRQDRKEVRSLIGCFVERVGFAGLVEALNRVADVAFVDSRVLFHHFRLDLSAEDRFNSDLMRPELVRDPAARELASAALESATPMALGGQCLVSGGLRALTDAVRDATKS